MRLAKINSKLLFKSHNDRGNKSALIPSCWLVTPLDRLTWPNLSLNVRMNTHLSNLFISAVSNIERTGRKLDDNDKKILRVILSFWSGWSATAVEHMNDPAFCYIRHRYSQIKNLEPILDSITYMEEVAWMPKKVSCEIANILLLGSLDRYYVYLVRYDALFEAGSTLKEVCDGLKGVYCIDTLDGSGWKEVDPFIELNIHSWAYFPDYSGFTRELMYDVALFIPPLPRNFEKLEDLDE